jgi:NADH/NAD ratio-sensing transcriptional regulator Rex
LSPYFSIKFLLEIIKKGAYFVCRYKQIAIYIEDEKTKKLKKINLFNFLKEHIREIFELEIYIQDKNDKDAEPEKIRIVFLPVPKDKAEQRRNKLIENAKKKGKTKGLIFCWDF